ncbi:L-fucose:H+ symporter permease [Virgibacillus ndiopensis]|uniref:L-fucose:H+ symporter permease n=1 Tax=Virgibacillus ndiopensis TaxID=2004408 RepID=UPI000C06DB5F|nr:L-fucose:H+ symporter permease [Virgibacillus ndiopensis]
MNNKNNFVQSSDGYLNRVPIFQYILVTILFPLWGAAASLNDILITQFKTIFELSDFATAFVQSAFYGGYFLLAIPASLAIKKTSYRVAIIVGLLFYIVGCLLFFPASHVATYSVFLVAIFAIAIGLSFLETSANTYSTMLGPRESATRRINISQTFYPIGAMAGILLGKYFVFTDGESLESQIAGMGKTEAQQFSLEMLERTLVPYKFIIVVLIIVLIIFLITKFPKCKAVDEGDKQRAGLGQTLKYLAKNKAYKKGILAQFIYMGLQTTVWSFTMRLALELDPTINERFATNFMIFSFIAFFCGRFIATFLMSRFKPTFVLCVYSIIGSAVLAYVAFAPNFSAVYGAIFVSVLFGPCWPTIYGRTLETVEHKKYVETAGAIIVMAIIGGAVMPVIQGLASDLIGSMQLSFLVPMFCFIFIAYYFYKENKDLSKQESQN